jgi:hypothetical protein
MLDARIVHYPAAIVRGQISETDAARDIQAWRAIAADWRFFYTLNPREGADVPAAAKLAAIELAIGRFQARADKAPRDQALADTVEALQALAWHQRRDGEPGCRRWCAEATIALRQARAQLAEAA